MIEDTIAGVTKDRLRE